MSNHFGTVCIKGLKVSSMKRSLREKCPNTEFFLVRIFLYSVRIQENTHQKKLRIWTLFTKWRKSNLVSLWVPHKTINWMKAKAADAYTKLSQTSKRELFVEIVNDWKESREHGFTRAWPDHLFVLTEKVH